MPLVSHSSGIRIIAKVVKRNDKDQQPDVRGIRNIQWVTSTDECFVKNQICGTTVLCVGIKFSNLVKKRYGRGKASVVKWNYKHPWITRCYIYLRFLTFKKFNSLTSWGSTDIHVTNVKTGCTFLIVWNCLKWALIQECDMQKINSNLRFKGEERWSLYRRKLQSTTLHSLKILNKLVYVQAFFINELKYIITFLSFTTLVRSFVRSILVLLWKKKAMAMFNIFANLYSISEK